MPDTPPVNDGTAVVPPSQSVTPPEGVVVPPEGTPPVIDPVVIPVKQEGPPSDHPRFTEIYGKMKDFERKTQEQDDTIEALRVHNKSLAESIDTVTDKFSVASRPDPSEDPNGYASWMEEKVRRDIKKEMASNNQPEAVSSKTQVPPSQPSQNDYNRDVQIAVMEASHDDYNTVIDTVKGDIENDAVLRNQIYSSPNPPKAAYEYGMRKKEAQAQTNNQGYVEGAGAGGVPQTNANATPEQVSMASKLGISVEGYMKQASHIAGRNR